MSAYKSECGCEIHVAQWTTKRKIVSVAYCPLHKRAGLLLQSLKLARSIIRGDDLNNCSAMEQETVQELDRVIDLAEGKNSS
jgi:hypothetical protein